MFIFEVRSRGRRSRGERYVHNRADYRNYCGKEHGRVFIWGDAQEAGEGGGSMSRGGFERKEERIKIRSNVEGKNADDLSNF